MKHLGKTLAYVLRHAPESVGVTLDSKGRADLATLAAALDVPVSEVIHEVSVDSKGRYRVEGDLIWAVQGHSIPVDVDMVELDAPGSLFHGTLLETWEEHIRESGLKRMSRQHVHLSVDEGTAQVVASRRKGETVMLLVDGARARELGVQFWRADNDVVLCTDVPAECVTLAEGQAV